MLFTISAFTYRFPDCDSIYFLAFQEVGGYDNLVTKYMKAEPSVTKLDAHNKSCGASPHYAMNLFRDPTPGASDLPWTGIIFGLSISSIWYWCSDQVRSARGIRGKCLINCNL